MQVNQKVLSTLSTMLTAGGVVAPSEGFETELEHILKALAMIQAAPPSLWNIVEVAPADRERMPPGATCAVCDVFDGVVRIVVWQTPEGWCLSIGHTSSDLSRVPDRLPTVPEVIYAVRNFWPQGTYAGVVIAGGAADTPLPDGLMATQVYPAEQAPAAARGAQNGGLILLRPD